MKITKSILKAYAEDIKIFTDGCFCGEAIIPISNSVYSVIMSFSCRKSMHCNSSYYDVHAVYLMKNATAEFSFEDMKDMEELLAKCDNGGSDIEELPDGVFLVYDWFEEQSVDNLFVEDDTIQLTDKAILYAQKLLFKEYMDTYGGHTEATFDKIGKYHQSELF